LDDEMTPLRSALDKMRGQLTERQHEAITMMRKRTRVRMPYPPESGSFPIGDWAASRALRKE